MHARKKNLAVKEKCRLKVKGWKMIFSANRIWKQAIVAILISEKAEITLKAVRRGKE
jgi:hypothetical protein